MRLLTVSDLVDPRLYTPAVRARVGAVDAIIGCGDLPYSYLEFLMSALDVPCVYVHGNHDGPEQRSDGTVRLHPQGCQDIDLRVVQLGDLLVAGVDGVVRYRPGAFQYTEAQWMRRLWMLTLRTVWAQQRHGQRLDILVTHAPPSGLHDGPRAHQGSWALRRFVERFQPRHLIHGHVHLNYGYGDQSPLQHGNTTIINTYGHLLLDIEPAAIAARSQQV